MRDSVEIRPVDQLEALQELLRGIPFEVHSANDPDKAYDDLAEGAACIIVRNPYQERKLIIDLAENFVLTYGVFSSSYARTPEGYERLVADIQGVLHNEICYATLYCGKEREWLGSVCITKEDIFQPVETIFSKVFSQAEFKDELRALGGEIQFSFWDPAEDRVVSLPRGERRQ